MKTVLVVDDELKITRLLRDYLPRAPVIYAYANNHYAGHGPATARELQALVGS